LPLLPFYGRPDDRYLLDDYTRFSTMEEVLREYVSSVNVEKHRNQYALKILYKDEAYQQFVRYPVVLVDGVPVFQPSDKVMQIDPLKIRKMDIVRQPYVLGPVTFDGIISLSTYKGDLEGFEPEAGSTYLDYASLQDRREFYAPVYPTAERVEGRKPDFRHLLFWTPDLRTDRNGKGQVSFYTSDLPGRYVVIAQGMSADGKPVQGTAHFDVQ
jgi:hypothetical protein